MFIPRCYCHYFYFFIYILWQSSSLKIPLHSLCFYIFLFLKLVMATGCQQITSDTVHKRRAVLLEVDCKWKDVGSGGVKWLIDCLLQEIHGYGRSILGSILTWSFIVLTAGILRVIFHWFPEWFLKCTYTPCSLETADKVLIVVTIILFLKIIIKSSQ